MSNFYRKRKIQQLVYSRGAIVLLLIPVGFIGYAAMNAYSKSEESGLRREAVEQELGAVEERQRALVADIELLDSDRGKEEALRERYQVGREGEQIIVLIDDEENTETLAPESVSPGFWERIFAIVF
jgi:cell division protein FtsB